MVWAIFKKKKMVIMQRDHNCFVQVGKGKKISTEKTGHMTFPRMIGVACQ